MKTIESTRYPTRAALGLTLALAACGGGGGGGGGGGSTFSVSGTVATGAAVAGANVGIVCARGSGTATSGADGRFSVTLTDAARPCALRTTAGSDVVHSLVGPGEAASITANLTPLTELLVARVAGGDADALFSSFDATAQAKVTQAALDAARAAVASALQPVADLSGLDAIAGDASVGSTLDQRLDALEAALATKALTLQDLITALASGSTDAAKRLLEPVATTCDGLRSGPFRLAVPSDSKLYGVIQFDATTLVVTLPDGTTAQLADNGTCSFSTADGNTLLFSKSGFAALVLASKTPSLILGVPEQATELSELAGTWNYVAYLGNPSTPTPGATPTNGYFTLDAAGKASQHFVCVGLNPCGDGGILPDLTVGAAGGFERASAGAVDHYYDFKTATGQHTMIALIDNASSFGYFVATKQASGTLPAVGEVTHLRSFTLDASGSASSIQDHDYTVTAVDATANAFTRERDDGRLETFAVDAPRAGYSTRAAGTNVNPIVSLRLPGSAASVFTSLAADQNFLGIGIQHP